jgi:hypothetical protein
MEMSILKPMKRWVTAALLGVTVLLLLGGGYAAWSYYDAPPLARYSQVLTMLSAGQLQPDSHGTVDLSGKFSGLTPKDLAYVTRHDDGSFLAMFPTYYGEGAQIAGLLYTSRPLRDEDLHQPDTAIHFDRRLIDVGSYCNLLLEKRINPSWYHVSYKLQ